jgi:hypothetical protein
VLSDFLLVFVDAVGDAVRCRSLASFTELATLAATAAAECELTLTEPPCVVAKPVGEEKEARRVLSSPAGEGRDASAEVRSQQGRPMTYSVAQTWDAWRKRELDALFDALASLPVPVHASGVVLQASESRPTFRRPLPSSRAARSASAALLRSLYEGAPGSRTGNLLPSSVPPSGRVRLAWTHLLRTRAGAPQFAVTSRDSTGNPVFLFRRYPSTDCGDEQDAVRV